MEIKCPKCGFVNRRIFKPKIVLCTNCRESFETVIPTIPMDPGNVRLSNGWTLNEIMERD